MKSEQAIEINLVFLMETDIFQPQQLIFTGIHA